MLLLMYLSFLFVGVMTSITISIWLFALSSGYYDDVDDVHPTLDACERGEDYEARRQRRVLLGILCGLKEPGRP